MIMEHLHETPLQGIVGTDKGELFYLLPIEKVSDLVKFCLLYTSDAADE